MLDLHDDVVIELAVERMENVISGPGTIVFGIAPIEMMVIDKGAIHDDAAMRLQSACNHVCGIRWTAPIARRSGTAFGVRFDQETGEVRDQAINLVGFFLPPRLHARIERIKSVKMAQGFRAGQVDGNSEAHTPRAK